MSSSSAGPPLQASTGTGIEAFVRIRPTEAFARDDVRLFPGAGGTLELRNVRRSTEAFSTAVVDSKVKAVEEFVSFPRFSQVFPASTPQAAVFDFTTADLVEDFLAGYTTALLAYGQTGSGKTHTMIGRQAFEERGIIPRSISYICQRIGELKRQRRRDDLLLKVSYLEIYQEKLIDLLQGPPEGGDLGGLGLGAVGSVAWNSSSNAGPSSSVLAGSAGTGSGAAGAGREHDFLVSLQKARPLIIAEDSAGRTVVKDLTSVAVGTELEALEQLYKGEANRAIAEHALNKGSTRSHCLFILSLEQEVSKAAAGSASSSFSPSDSVGESSRSEECQQVISRCFLVDLAGSERVEKTAAEGTARLEAQAINKSLSFLEQVVLALADKDRPHKPFRSSKLTHVLKDALGGHAKCRFIATIWPERAHLEEGIHTLRFASRLRAIKAVPKLDIVPSKTVDVEARRALAAARVEIEALKMELKLRDGLSAVAAAETSAGAAGNSAATALNSSLQRSSGPAAGAAGAAGAADALGQLPWLRPSPADLAAISPAVDAFLSGSTEFVMATSMLQLQSAMLRLRQIVRELKTGGGRDRAAPAAPAQKFPPAAAAAPEGSPVTSSSTSSGLSSDSFSGNNHPPIVADTPAAAAESAGAAQNKGGAEKEKAAGSASSGEKAGGAAASAAPSSSTDQSLQSSSSKIDGQFAAQLKTTLTEEAKAAALASWCAEGGRGEDLGKQYAEAKQSLRAQKQVCNGLVTAVNGCKQDIDRLKASITAAQSRSAAGEGGNDGAAAPSEKEKGVAEVQQQLKAAQGKYRDLFNELQEARKDAAWMQSVCDSLAKQVAQEFEEHWQQTHPEEGEKERGKQGRAGSISVISSAVSPGPQERRSRVTPTSPLVSPARSIGLKTAADREQLQRQQEASLSSALSAASPRSPADTDNAARHTFEAAVSKATAYAASTASALSPMRKSTNSSTSAALVSSSRGPPTASDLFAEAPLPAAGGVSGGGGSSMGASLRSMGSQRRVAGLGVPLSNSLRFGEDAASTVAATAAAAAAGGGSSRAPGAAARQSSLQIASLDENMLASRFLSLDSQGLLDLGSTLSAQHKAGLLSHSRDFDPSGSLSSFTAADMVSFQRMQQTQQQQQQQQQKQGSRTGRRVAGLHPVAGAQGSSSSLLASMGGFGGGGALPQTGGVGSSYASSGLTGGSTAYDSHSGPSYNSSLAAAGSTLLTSPRW